MSRSMQFVVGGVVMVAIIAIGWFLLLAPVRNDISSTSSSVLQTQQTLTELKTELAQAEQTKEEGRKNEEQLVALAKMVPADDEIPSLLVQIQDLAAQAGIDFVSITPSSAVDGNGFSVIPLEAEFQGTFFDVSDFVYRAEQMAAGPGRLLAVKSISLDLAEQSDSAATPTLKATITLDAFVAPAKTNGSGANSSSSSAAASTTTTTSSK